VGVVEGRGRPEILYLLGPINAFEVGRVCSLESPISMEMSKWEKNIRLQIKQHDRIVNCRMGRTDYR
jgi:hypothetical protein